MERSSILVQHIVSELGTYLTSMLTIMQSNNSDIHNSSQKLVLHMWQEDSADEQSPERKKHIHKESHRHRHRNR